MNSSRQRKRRYVYLDTNVLGHWLLYHSAKLEHIQSAPRRVRSSLDLLNQIRDNSYSCLFETSDFAFAELYQVIRDNIIAKKMVRDGQSLVYFYSLKNEYQLTLEEVRDVESYLDAFYEVLRTVKVKAYVVSLDMPSIEEFVKTLGISTSDAIHIAWAASYDYFATCDTQIIKLRTRIEHPKIVLPSALHSIRELRRN